MDIGLYIVDLLRNQDEVSLPGLGTFSKKRVTGAYDPANNSFFPPSYQVDFSPENSNTNTLREYISARKNLSASSAEYFINKFVSTISELLESSGMAELKPLGFIRRENAGLIFEASQNLQLGGNFYGLKPVTDLYKPNSPVGNDPEVPAIQEAPIEDNLISHSDEEIEEEEEVAEEPRRNRILLIFAGALLFAIIAAALLYLFNPGTRNLIDGISGRATTAVQPVLDSANIAKPSPSVVRDSIINVTPPLERDSSGMDTTATTKTEIKSPEPAIETTTIEIIGAAFGKRREADRYVLAMNKRGLNARVLEDMPGPLFKVSLASFPNLQSAQKELIRIKKEVEKDAWPTPYKSKKTQ